MSAIVMPIRVLVAALAAFLGATLLVQYVAPSTRGAAPARSRPAPGSAAGLVQHGTGVLSAYRDLGSVTRGQVSLVLTMRTRRFSSRSKGSMLHVDPFRSRYAPSAHSLRRVERYLRLRGLGVAPQLDGAWLLVRGAVDRVDRIFHIDVHRYGRRHLPAFESSSPGTVPTDIRGMVSGAGRISTMPIRTDIVPAGGFSPSGIQAAYDITPLINQGIDGRGQTVVFVEIDGLDGASLKAYAARFHLPPFHITVHGPAFQPGDEATMDVEVVHAIAPMAKLVVYNIPGNTSNAEWDSRTAQMISHVSGDVISESVGLCESDWSAADLRALQLAYVKADLSGEAPFASTGDNGAFGCIQNGQVPSTSNLGIQVPAGCPGVTAVGGTRLSVTSSGSWFDETAWEDPIETGGSGGGPSIFFKQPGWQKAPGVAAQDILNNPSHGRMVPDVSADADNASGMDINLTGGRSEGGGTSQAAPIWAAITALADEYLGSHHHAPVGWMNPALYHLASTKQPFPPFHDVVTGTNLNYPAATGYDMATGLGSPDAYNLARDLLHYSPAHP
ncbi:MAG TPA: S53 family peptidase [Chloroflexota bacterium]|nr:S53 family peptidase [Chloroflexota bacterium]